MNTVAKPSAPTHTPRQLPPAANEHQGEAGLHAIAAMRAALGKTSAASKFDRLSQQQKAILLTAARLRPSQYINKPLMTLTDDEREAVRQALLSLVELGKAFACVPLSREQFFSSNKKPAVYQAGKSGTAESEVKQTVNNEFEQISKLAAELAADLTSIEKH